MEFCTYFEFCTLLRRGGGGGPKSFSRTEPLNDIYGDQHGVVIGDSDELNSNWRNEISGENVKSDYDWSIDVSHFEDD